MSRQQRARRLAVDLLSPRTQQPLESLLSKVYGKPVELNMTELKQPHLNPDIFAQRTAKHLNVRHANVKQVVPSMLRDVQPPTSQSQVLSLAARMAISEKALSKDPSTSSLARSKAPVSHIMHSLQLKQVSSVLLTAKGRLGARLNADRASKSVTRKGLTNKGPGHITRGVTKNNVEIARALGKKRTGAFSIDVEIGHS